MTNTLRQLEEIGQSIWYDNISRPLLESGELRSLIDGGVLGVTSNPTIFEKAITGGTAYDAQAREFLGARPGAGAAPLVRALMIRDIQAAADLFLPVYERTEGRDGYVSVEVTPGKARDTAGTVAEAAELWSQVGRPNAMIKIPATREGLPAIEETIAAGINVNVTLIFSVERYREVADAYCRGLERRRGAESRRIASVASVFVSRIDTMVDDLLGKKIAAADAPRAAGLRKLLGKAAVANAKMVYQAFKEIFAGPRFASLAAAGASVQRPLWASTGTKNPAYSDLLYVDTLIGPHTVNTVPPATLGAIIDHSRPALTVENDLTGAGAVLTDLLASGIDLPAVMRTLEEEGVARYAGLKQTNELIRAFDASAAMVHFPSEESFGLVVAEGLARGLKFFGARLGGIPEITAGVAEAELFAPEDWSGLSSAIASWIRRGFPRCSGAEPSIRARYHPSVIARRHVEIYREVLDRPT